MVLFPLGLLFLIVAALADGLVILKQWVKDLVDDPLLQLSVGDESQRAQKWR
jgi:hypothetical protein